MELASGKIGCWPRQVGAALEHSCTVGFTCGGAEGVALGWGWLAAGLECTLQ